MSSLFNTPRTRFAKQLHKAGEFNESDHPRDEDGKFTSGHVGGALYRSVLREKDRRITGAVLATLGGLAAGGLWTVANRRRLAAHFGNAAMQLGGNPSAARRALHALRVTAVKDYERLHRRTPGKPAKDLYGVV